MGFSINLSFSYQESEKAGKASPFSPPWSGIRKNRIHLLPEISELPSKVNDKFAIVAKRMTAPKEGQKPNSRYHILVNLDNTAYKINKASLKSKCSPSSFSLTTQNFPNSE